MDANTGSDTLDVYGALMLASAMIKDPFLPELVGVAVRYFKLSHRPQRHSRRESHHSGTDQAMPGASGDQDREASPSTW